MKIKFAFAVPELSARSDMLSIPCRESVALSRQEYGGSWRAVSINLTTTFFALTRHS